jgi:demethylmenaquinone methyltransferase / 2-methoxy-6-polyprenyl-1,4-benzoquinol methylase
MGTTPQGTLNEQEAARWVRGMFGNIAGRYDLLNHLLSFNLDRYWRSHTVRRVNALTPGEGRVLDLCCGTGDLMLALERQRGRAIFGADFCHPMLTEARRKTAAGRFSSTVFEADGLVLPLLSDSLDLITVAFGFRNFANYNSGLQEMLRVLKPGGVAAILEFSQPRNRAFGSVYNWFSTVLLPRIGGLVSGSRQAYSYLPQSIRKFPNAETLAAQMMSAGFMRVEYDLLTFGTVALHLGWK